MKNIPAPNRNTERGQSLVELAVSLLVLLMLLTGAVEVSLALFQFVTIRDAAQEGALYGSIAMANNSGVISNTVRSIEWRAIKTADDVVTITQDNVKVEINGVEITEADMSAPQYCEGAAADGTPNYITVIVTFSHPITFPFIAAVSGRETIDLTASATNTILQPVCP